MKHMRFFMVVCILAAFAAVVFPMPAAAQEETRVIIQYRANGRAAVMQRLQSQGARVNFQFDELNAVVVSLPAQAVNAMRANPDVLAIEPDEPRYLSNQTVPYGVDAIQARNIWDANFDGLIDAGAPTGAGRTICIIDSGIQRNHEDFQGVNIIGGYPAGWDTDNYGHGTHVAGTIAAMNNAVGVVGVTPGTVSLYILKVFGDTGGWTYASTLVDAAYRCRDAGANIITMSLEGANFSSIENYAFNQLYNDYGILSVAAAGNSGGTAYAYPASYEAVISVGAVDQNKVVASFSRRNDRVELVAPGVSVYSTYKNNSYANMSGTSMATPHVAAAAALVWSANPSWTNAQIRQALSSSAQDLGEPGRDNAYGYGLVQAQSALTALGGAASTPPAPNTPPVATFNFSCTDLTCAFDAGASYDPDGSLVSYAWNFGDGANGSGITANRSYTAAGGYSVTLTVTDNQGATATAAQNVTVSAPISDTTPPVISDVKATKSGNTNFILSWTTDEPATTVVIVNGVTYTDNTLSTAHTMTIRGKKGVTYTYYVQSADAAGNTAAAGPFTYKN